MKRSLDSHLLEIRKAYNRALSDHQRLQIISVLAKVPFRKLNQFNPPKPEKIEENLTTDDEIATEDEEEMEVVVTEDEEMVSEDREDEPNADDGNDIEQEGRLRFLLLILFDRLTTTFNHMKN